MTTDTTLSKFGFKFGQSGAHSARSMMLDELRALFSSTTPHTPQEEYQADICDFNLLDKPTVKSRSLTYRHLVDLYGMNRQIPIFRVFRDLWDIEINAQPVLALQVALIRDPLLRLTMPFMQDSPPGAGIVREDVEALLKAPDPERFSPASLKSFAQNINGSWTQAGFLEGRKKKVRSEPIITVVNVTFALFLAYLEGATGERLFHSKWCQILGLREHQLVELAMVANQRGIIDFKRSGGVTDVRFPGFLTQEEEQWRYE
jgi:hypothetical protein